MEQVVRIHASSGTTGKPTVVGYTQNDIDNWANIVARSLRAAGLAQRQNSCCLWLRPVYWWAGCALWCRTSGRYGDPDVWRADGKQAQLIRDFQPDMIMVTPSYCLNLIEELERQLGGDASGCSLRVGVFGAEPWTQAMRKEIERRLGITALDIYGLSEVMGPGWRWSVWKLPTAQPFGKIISILKLLILMTAHRLPMVNMANCYSPR